MHHLSYNDPISSLNLLVKTQNIPMGFARYSENSRDCYACSTPTVRANDVHTHRQITYRGTSDLLWQRLAYTCIHHCGTYLLITINQVITSVFYF